MTIILMGVLLSSALTWANYRFALQSPGGNDFLVHYEASRAFFLEGISPYSDQVAVRIQKLAYGRPALPGEHEMGVAYPIYSTLLFAPFALIDNYPLARALWMTLLELALMGMAILNLRLTSLKLGRLGLATYLLFVMLWYHSMRPLINGNAVVLVALFVSLAVYLLYVEKDLWSGLILSLATIKPNLVVLAIPLLLIWAYSRQRWRLIWGYLIAQIALVAIGCLLMSNWIEQNLREVKQYPSYNPPGSPIGIFETWLPGVGYMIGLALTLILAILLVYEWRAAFAQGYRWFLWTLCLTLVISQLIGLFTDPGNFIILLMPLVLVFVGFQEIWDQKGIVAAYLLMVLLLVGLWALFISTVNQSYQPIQHPVMFFPLPSILLISLYKIREQMLTKVQ